MDSRDKLKSSADALMVAATAEQQKEAEQNTRSMVRLYPGLSRVPPMERHSALRAAREAASSAPISKALLALITLALAAAVASGITGHWSVAVATFAGAMLAAIVRQFIEITLARRHLDSLPGTE